MPTMDPKGGGARMARHELLLELRDLRRHPDPEYAHAAADRAVVRYLADPEIESAYEAIDRPLPYDVRAMLARRAEFMRTFRRGLVKRADVERWLMGE